MTRTIRTMVSLVAVAIISAACSAGSSPGGTGVSSPGTRAVNIELKEYSIIPEVSSRPAGSVTLTVRNSGTIEHEMVVLRTDLAPATLPVEGDKVNEQGPGVTAIGEIEDIQAGATKSKTFNLTPGKYIFVCNIPGHYRDGMVATFEVK